MALVINVPRDERFGELGEGAGGLLSAIITRKKKDKDADALAKLSSGDVQVSDIMGTLDPGNRQIALSIDSNRQAKKKSFIKLDEGGKAIEGIDAVTKPEGFVRSDVAAFNKPKKASEKTVAIKEVIATQERDNPSFAERDTNTKNRIARNISNAQSVLNKEVDKDAKLDPIGNRTEENARRNMARTEIYQRYITGDENTKPILNPATAISKTNKDVEKLLKDYKKAQIIDPNMSFQNFLSTGMPEAIPKPPVKEEAPGLIDQGIQGIRDFISGIGEGAPSIADPALSTKPEPATGPSDVELATPEIRVQDATDAAINANYAVQDGEQWVEVSDGLTLVPQSMLDMVKAGDAEFAAQLYTSMNPGMPLHVALGLLKANAYKAPLPSLLDTKVIPDPISDGQ